MKKILSSRLFLLFIVAILTIFTLRIIKNYSLALIPFSFSVFIVIATRKTVSLIEKVTGLSSKTAARVSLIISYIIAVAVIFLLGYIVYKVLSSLAQVSPSIILKKITAITELIKNNVNASIIEKISKVILDLSVSFISVIGNFILNVPELVISISFSVIASFFIVNDYENIKRFLSRQFNDKTLIKISEVKNMLILTLSKIFVSYFLLFIVNFIILFIGFALLGVKNTPVIAVLISFADILPIIGIAIFLVPWAIFSALNGKIYFAVGLITLLIIALIIKSILEPKIIGKKLGLHPLITLISMFFGMQIGGFIGSLLMPLVMIILIYLNNNEIIKLYRL